MDPGGNIASAITESHTGTWLYFTLKESGLQNFTVNHSVFWNLIIFFFVFNV